MICSSEGCTREAAARGFCHSHYTTWWRKNRDVIPQTGTWEERFWGKIDRSDPSGCWVWTASENGYGYGQACIGHQRAKAAHIVAYERLVGPVPDGLELDHLCRNRLCVNPAHLEAVTHRENCLRGVGVSAINAVKTTCVNGHSYDEENTYVDRRGFRHCRECSRERDRLRRPRGVPRVKATA